MSRAYFISDPHLGHKNIWKFREGCESAQENDDKIISNLKKTLKKRDTLYILGDVAFSREHLFLLKEVNCRKVLILGNHDCERERNDISMSDFQEVFDDIRGLLSYKDFWLSHAPIHPEELRGKFNIHGHVHANSLSDTRYFNCCVDATNFKPVPIEDIKHYCK